MVGLFMPRNDNNCKIIRNEPDWTPNNYEISFNPSDIPSNIKTETSDSLQKKLQRLLPTSKRIHIMLSSKEMTENNDLKIHTGLRINNKEVNFK